MPSYAELVAQGKIKSYHNRSSINQLGLNDIAGDNQKGENALTEAQTLTKNNAINFTHNTDVFTQSSVSAVGTYNFQTNTAPSFNINSQISSLSGLTQDAIKEKAKQIFIKNMVQDSLREENKLETSLGMSRDNILKFLNNSRDTNNNLISADNYINYSKAADLFYDVLVGDVTYESSDNNTVLTGEQQILESFLHILEDDIIEGKHLYVYLAAMKNINLKHEPKSYINAKGEEVTGQVEKGGKTVMEYIAIHNFKLAMQAMNKSMVDPKFKSVRAAGGEVKADYQQRLKNKQTPTEIKNELDLIIKEIMISNPELTNVRVAQTVYSGSGSKEAQNSVHVADLIYEVEDLGSRFIDIKMHKGKNKKSTSRYKLSSPLKTSITNLYNKNMLDESAKKDFTDQLSIILNYLYFRMLNGQNINDYDKQGDKILKSLITHAILSSKVFFEYYRNYTGIEFQQADFLLTLKGYVWYSDFFNVFVKEFFEGTGGTKASIKLKASAVTENQNKINNIKILKAMESSIESNKEINLTELELFQKFVVKFMTLDHIEWIIDIDNIYEKVQRSLGSYIKK